MAEIGAHELSTLADRRRTALVFANAALSCGAGLSAKIALPVNDSPVCETMIQAPDRS